MGMAVLTLSDRSKRVPLADECAATRLRLIFRTSQLFFTVVLCTNSSLAQQAATVPTLKLKVRDSIPVPSLFATPIMFPARCDREGNVYVRFYQYPAPLAAPFVRISKDGAVTATYTLPSGPDYKTSQSSEFALGPRGEFFLIATSPGPQGERKVKVDILSFDKDGKYKDKIELGLRALIPVKILPLTDGNFFITGRLLISGEGSADNFEPFTAIVDHTGSVIRNLRLQNDVKFNPKKISGQSGKSDESDVQGSGSVPLSEVSLGEAVLGDDGNIYLMRRTLNPSVYVITSSGELVRRFEVKRTSDSAEALDMKWGAGGKLVFLFRNPSSSANSSQLMTYSIVDAETGDTQMNYEATAEVGVAMACYGPDGFTIVGSTDDGHLAIKRAVPY